MPSLPRSRMIAIIASTLVSAALGTAAIYAFNYGDFTAARWLGSAAGAGLCVLAGACIPGANLYRNLLLVGGVMGSFLLLGFGFDLLNLFERVPAESISDAGWVTIKTVVGYAFIFAAVIAFFSAVFNTKTPTSSIQTPLLRPMPLLLGGLALCIGWGIRGNFGHEYGAMIPGALTGIAVALCSGRADWRQRAAFFGLLGGLGWGFGGSVSYMHSVSYSDSGQWETLWYGSFLCWAYGFLWAVPGVAGTAMAASWDRDRLTEFLRPLLWLVGFYVLLDTLYYFMESLEQLEIALSRHESALYWFDADWLEAGFAILAMWAFDLWDRGKDDSPDEEGVLAVVSTFVGFLARGAWALAFGIVGAASTLILAGLAYLIPVPWTEHTFATMLGSVFMRRIGEEPAPIDGIIAIFGGLLNIPVTEYAQPFEFAAEGTEPVVNLPQLFDGLTSHLVPYFITYGVIGLLIGMAVYFALMGRFAKGSSLILHMAIGWFVVFLLCPVILGIRATPPRGDNWAGMVGVFLGFYVYFVRYNWKQVAWTALLGGAIGGVGLSGIVWLRKFLLMPGHPGLGGAGEISPGWQHYQQQNWHSWFEQSYGFVNGIAVVIALAVLSRYQTKHAPERRIPGWATAMAAAGILIGFGWVNMVKNPPEWVKQGDVPAVMSMPLLRGFEFGATTWFNLIWIVMTVALCRLMYVHLKRPLAIVPTTSIGKGQLLFVAFVGAMAVMNFERALPAFGAGRILTEGVIFLNAILASYLILTIPRQDEEMDVTPVASPQWRMWTAWGITIALCLSTTAGHTVTTYKFYMPRELNEEVFAATLARAEGDTAIGVRDRAILDLYYMYPLASLELANLPVSAYDPAAGTIAEGDRDPIELADATRQRLDAWLEIRTTLNLSTDNLFTTLQGHELGAWGIWSAVRTYDDPDWHAVPRQGNRQVRFDDDAEWRIKPLRKGQEHN